MEAGGRNKPSTGINKLKRFPFLGPLVMAMEACLFPLFELQLQKQLSV